MAFVFLVIGGFVASGLRNLSESGATGIGQVPFNVVYAIVGNFVFGMGSLLVMIYVGAIVGGDYSWGVLRNVFSRGESRIRYALAKAASLAIVIAIGAAISLVLGELMLMLVGADGRIDFGSPFSADALTDLVKAFGLGCLVLFERAAIGFAVTVVLRSQIAGIVVGVILYIAEPFVAGFFALFSALGQITEQVGQVGPTTPQVHWSQFLPFTVGSSVLTQGHAAFDLLSISGGITAAAPLGQAVAVLLLYGVIALAIACLVMRRQEIVG
jgi:ABC-type transport system involved in multi-copper enzyme maturation permease subunit